MSEWFDVFFCYRRSGAQTAKLFKRHWLQKGWPGAVWYSDEESFGNFKEDIPVLINQVQAAVIFLSEGFTAGFLNILEGGKGEECITAHEIVEIARKKLTDDSFRILTVNLEGYTLTAADQAILRQIFTASNLPEHCVSFFTQCNRNHFHTAVDHEDAFFDRISEHLLPDEFYRTHLKGSFSFGSIPTSADLIIWEKNPNGIHPENIAFSASQEEIDFYRTLENARAADPSAKQNDMMLSVVSCAPFYARDKVLQVDIAYKAIEYRLFEKGIFLRNNSRLGIHKRICEYLDRSEPFPIPNAMGMAIMVVTADKKLVFSRRSAQRRIRPLEYDCSIVEGMKFEDAIPVQGQPFPYSIDDPAYVEYEFRRAYLEEMCPDDSDIRICVSGVALDREYAQWNLIGTIFTEKTQAELEQMTDRRLDSYEARSLFFVPYVDAQGEKSLEPIAKALAEYRSHKLWAMALVALYSALSALGFQDKDISQYPW